MYTCAPCQDHWRAKDKFGYHRVHPNYFDGYRLLHRYRYAKYYRVDLTPEEVIRHRCNNAWCIEITHLIKGTQKDNLRDTYSTETPFSGAKLTREKALEIRKLYGTTNLSQRKIGEMYGVAESTISRIVNGQFWRKVGR